MRIFKVLCQFLITIGCVFLTSPAYSADGSSFQDIFGAAQANIDPTESASNKVKLSGRQMMLNETIVKSICFASLGIDTDENLMAAARASALFSESLDALRTGSVQKSVIRESEPKILKHLDKLSDSWRPFKNTVNSVLTTRAPTKENLEELRRLSRDILVHSRSTARAIEKHYGNSSLGEEIANTIGMAGNQRTLIQKATKQFCLITADVDVEANQLGLMSTRELFFNSIFDLFFGNEDTKVVAPTNLELEIIYEELFAVWFALEELFDQANSDVALDEASLELSLDLTDHLVSQSEIALSKY